MLLPTVHTRSGACALQSFLQFLHGKGTKGEIQRNVHVRNTVGTVGIGDGVVLLWHLDNGDMSNVTSICFLLCYLQQDQKHSSYLANCKKAILSKPSKTKFFIFN